MTIPMVRTTTVFNAADATATKNLIEVDGFGQLRTARSVFLEINGGDTPNWALDIQGRVDESATWHNVDYFRTDQGAAVTPSVAQLAVTWSTAQHYVVPNPPPFLRLVGTRTGGTLTVYAAFSSEAYSVPFSTVNLEANSGVDIGDVDVLSIAAGTNLIGKFGIDQTTPGTTNGVAGTGTALSPSANVLTTQRPAVTQVVSTALEASHVLKASAGQLVELSVFNSKASAQFILILNSATLTADGAVTLLYPPIPIAAVSLVVLDIPAPIVASAGITVCNSSTGSFTKTIGSADCAFYAQVN